MCRSLHLHIGKICIYLVSLGSKITCLSASSYIPNFYCNTLPSYSSRNVIGQSSRTPAIVMSFLQYHSPTEDKGLWPDRPVTVKPDSESHKRLSTRPISASKQFLPSKSGTLLKAKRPPLPDAATLTRMKPKYIALDKERLYEEALALKMEANYFREENVKLRTKMQQLERELEKRDETLEDLRTTAKEKHFSTTLQSLHLISSLKSTVKDLRNELKTKEEESQKAKRDMRTSRISELEVELRAYVDECTRLKHHLEEAMERLMQESQGSRLEVHNSEEVRALEEDLKARTEDWKHAKGQITHLETALKAANLREKELNAQLKTLKGELEKLSESQKAASNAQESQLADLAQSRQLLLVSNEHTQALEGQIQLLKSELEACKQHFMPKESSKLAIVLKPDPCEEEEDRAMIAAIEKSTGVSLVEFVEKCSQALAAAQIAKKRIARNVLTAVPIEASELLIALQAVGVETGLVEVQTTLEQPAVVRELLELLQSPPKTQTASQNPSANGTFRIKEDVENQVAPYFPESKTPVDVSVDPLPALVVSDETASALKAFGFRLQLHRIPKSKLGVTLFGHNYDAKETITAERLEKALCEPPLSLSPSDQLAQTMQFALEASHTAQEVVARLSVALEDWEVFSPADEAEFDRHISLALASVKAEFQAACALHDPANSGHITMKALREVCESLHFDFNSREYHYMELLFFSLNFTLDEVPFNKLIQAYAAQDSDASFESRLEESVDDQDKKRIVREYMDRISSELMRKSLNPRQIFRSLEGILYPDKLVAGMRTLGIPDMKEREMVVFLEALQCEDIDEYGIEMSLFEEIIKGYREQEVGASGGHSV